MNAGHNSPIVMHRDGSHDRLCEGGGVLGIFAMQTYAMGAEDLQTGDRVLLFTDGVTEARDADGTEFGEARLIQLMEDHRDTSADELQRKIMSVVGDFCEGNFHDDATMIVVAVA